VLRALHVANDKLMTFPFVGAKDFSPLQMENDLAAQNLQPATRTAPVNLST
jgi:hypothetical protein